MEALSLVPPEILRYVIARSKINRHIEFDTGSALFQTADEYERLVANPIRDEGEMSKRQLVAAETQRGAIRLSQVNPESDPIDSVGGVSFRHLSMLAQIKSSDGDVWSSLNRSGHIEGDPSDSLRVRLARMRSWIGGPTSLRMQSWRFEARSAMMQGLRLAGMVSLSSDSYRAYFLSVSGPMQESESQYRKHAIPLDFLERRVFPPYTGQ